MIEDISMRSLMLAFMTICNFTVILAARAPGFTIMSLYVAAMRPGMGCFSSKHLLRALQTLGVYLRPNEVEPSPLANKLSHFLFQLGLLFTDSFSFAAVCTSVRLSTLMRHPRLYRVKVVLNAASPSTMDNGPILLNLDHDRTAEVAPSFDALMSQVLFIFVEFT